MPSPDLAALEDSGADPEGGLEQPAQRRPVGDLGQMNPAVLHGGDVRAVVQDELGGPLRDLAKLEAAARHREVRVVLSEDRLEAGIARQARAHGVEIRAAGLQLDELLRRHRYTSKAPATGTVSHSTPP